MSIQKITFRACFVYLLASLFLFYEMALQVSPSVMTHVLMRDLHTGSTGIGFIAGIYFYSYTVMQVPAGLLFDRISARTLLTAMLAVCVLGALLFGVAQHLTWILAGRFLMGIGSAFAFIGVLVMAARWFPPKYFALLVGIAQLWAAMGAMGGEVPLSRAVQQFGWRGTIEALVVIGAILTVLVWLVIRDYPQGQSSSIKALPKQSMRTSLQQVLSNRQTWWVGLYAFSNWGTVTVFAALWGIPFLMALYHISSTEAAMMVAMIWLGLATASPVVGWLSDWLGRRNGLLTACALLGAICSAVAIFVAHLPLWFMFVLLFGFGIAASGQILSFAVINDINQSNVVGTAIGVNNMAVVIGGALFQPLVGWLLHKHWAGLAIHGVPVYQVSDYRFALAIVPLSFLAGALISRVAIDETHCKPRA